MSLRQFKISKSITNRESESLNKYLQEISKMELVTSEQEVQLAASIRQGNQKAIEKLIKANLRFVVSVAKQYQNQGLSLSDLINEGNIGLIKAAGLYDETKGFKFISYAIWWIRQSIMQAVAEKSRLVRLPINKVGMSIRVNKALIRLEQEYEREPSAEEIAESIGLEVNEITNTLNQRFKHISMDAPISNDGEESTIADFLENPNASKADFNIVHQQSLKIEVNRTLQKLNNKEQQVIKFFFGIDIDRPFVLDEIAEKMQLSRERVRQIKDMALEKLKKSQQTNVLRTFLSAA